MKLVISNRLDEIPGLAQHVDAFGKEHGLASEVVEALQLATEELVTNIIHYAYDNPQSRHQIEISISLLKNGVEVVIVDDGKPFSPLEAAKPDLDATLSERVQGGLGIHLVKQFMDHIDYVRDSGRNRVTLFKATG